MIFIERRLVTMKSNLPFVSLTYSVVLACGLLLGGHESWGEEKPNCADGKCLPPQTAPWFHYPNNGTVSYEQAIEALKNNPFFPSQPNPATNNLAASNAAKIDNLIASNAMGGDASTTISNALQNGDITRQAVVDWMNDGLGGEPLKGLIRPNETLQSVVDGGNISQEKADAIANALGKESAADVTPEDIEEFQKKAEEEEEKEGEKTDNKGHAREQKDNDKEPKPAPGDGGGCDGGGGGGGGGLLAGLGQAAMQMLPQLLQGMLQNQGNQQGLDNQLDQLTQEQLDQDFLDQFVFPTQTAIAQATAFAETATAIAEETEGAEDTSNSNSEEETSEESEATPAPTPTPTSNPYHI